MLESAPNALDKGQAQYLTPPALAMEVAQALPRHRPTIVDLNCGYGALLQGAANQSTAHLLGCDIDPCRASASAASQHIHSVSRITADLTLLYPLLCEVNWRADLFVLNPPWDLHWHKDRLRGLADNTELRFDELLDVVDPRVGAAQIDSTIATLMIALDRSTYNGEGVLIANHGTIERLIYARNAPYAQLQERIWARRVIQGNPMTGRAPADTSEPSQSNQSVEVLYFARNSDYAAASPVATVSRSYRYGPSIRELHQCHTLSVPLWRAVAEEWRDRTAAAPPRFNISLGSDGTIRTHLSTFTQHTGKLDRELVAKLFELNGQRPMQLVQQRATRQALLGTMKLWNVAPELNAAAAQALTDYNAIRAPLYPLPEIQRLGYLEEEDTIVCKAAFVIDNITFNAGERYPIRSATMPIERHVWRCNLSGEDEDILLTGKELVFYIGHTPETEVAFILNPPLATKITGPRLPLTALVEHFTIPEVPDVASTNPAQYLSNLRKLKELESAFPEEHGIKLKQRQREDIARAGCHDGDVLAWEPGLGKTMAGFLFALVKVGYTIKK